MNQQKKCLTCPMLTLCTRKELKKRGVRIAEASDDDLRSVSSRDACEKYDEMLAGSIRQVMPPA